MGRWIACAVVVAVVSGSLPAAAGARLPKPASNRIVLGKSIGGVRPGMSLAVAQKAWGPGGISEAGDACQEFGRTSCIWKGRSTRERAILEIANDGTIDAVRIIGGPTSPLARLKTAKGFGLGTKISSLMHAYPGRLPHPAGLGAPAGTGSVFVVQRTEFFTSRNTGRVLGVEM